LPTWGQLLTELGQLAQQYPPGPEQTTSPHDRLRHKYLTALYNKTQRAVILYYSAFQEKPDAQPRTLSVNSADMAGFMEACSSAKERDLDLFLHSPGGDPDATEQILGYLRTQFDHIRAIVPVYAMSAATMIALGADEIVMGAHSQLGPIDPQFTIGTPEGPRQASAQAIKDQFKMAREQCQDPKNLAAWTPILRGYLPGLLAACDHAAKRANKIVATALEAYMFADHDDPAGDAARTADWFGDAEEFLSHGRPVRRHEAREQGVNVNDLEDDPELQDLVLSVHHAVMLTLSGTGTVKLVENHHGRAWIQAQQVFAVQGQIPTGTMPSAPEAPAPIPAPTRKPPPPPPRRRSKR
jgi:ATP-dependent protease ClpP protease subunit